MPTFRRPQLLRRALESVRNQTFDDWRCIVFDDCPAGSAKAIVESIGDKRFEYRRNAVPLGAIGNIDQAFRSRPYVGGDYACVVEDDNYLLPAHLEAQLETCNRERVPISFSAQYVEAIETPGEPGVLTDDRTIAWIYPEGRHTWREMLPGVLFSHAFSNGSVFWNLRCRSDFEIGLVTRHPGVQETLRMLRLRDDVHVSHLATSVWRSNDSRDSYVSRAARRRWLEVMSRLQKLTERREINDYREWYLAHFGDGDATAVAKSLEPNLASAVERAILLTGRNIRLTDRPTASRWSLLAKGHVFRAVVPARLDLRGFDIDVAAS
jgi:glycosyltransferase involved in cell wall biosynthesis